MKWISLIACFIVSISSVAQNHSKKPIRFIFESIHDHLGNLDINSKRVKLFSPDHRLLYEADFYDGVELDEQFFYYDDEGKLLRDHRIFHKPHESGDFRMTYDDKGNLIEETNVDDQGHTLEKITMTYNGKGQMVTEKKAFFHESEGHMITESSFEFTYDDKGRILTKKGWEDEKEDKIVTYKYEHKPNSETIKKYNSSDVMVEKWVQETDENGKLIKDIHGRYPPGRSPAIKTIDFTYDEYGHILTETLSKSNSSLKKQIIFEYVYDDYGNWIERKEKKIMGVREKEGVHLKRYIEYYEHDKYEHPPMEMDESFVWETREGENVKLFQETHVRITNNDGELEWVVRRNGQSLFQVDEYEYDKDGKLERINHLNNSKGENAYTIAKYNDKGLMTEISSYNFQDLIDEKTVYEYDDKGRMIRKEELFTGKIHGPLKTVLVEEYKYNGEGQLIQSNLTEYGSEYETEYEYDDAGNVIKEIQKPKAKDEEVIIMEYEYENGKLVSEKEFEGKKKELVDEARYKYDDRGELVQSAHYRNGKIHTEIDYVYFE